MRTWIVKLLGTIATFLAFSMPVGAFANGASGSDLPLREVTRFQVPFGPKSLRFTHNGKNVVVDCLYAHKVVVIDSATYKVIRTISVPDEPVECCITPDDTRAWVSLYNTHRVLEINLTTGIILRIRASWNNSEGC